MKSALTPCEFDPGGLEAPGAGRPLVLLFADGQSAASRALERTISELAPAYSGRLRFESAKPPEAADLLQRFCIHSIPGLVVLHDESVLFLAMGILPRRELEAIFDAAARHHVAKAFTHMIGTYGV
jgi:thioredoxin-like negative regulator of GroEL